MAAAWGECFIGTSGWSYPHWGGGRFYPRGLDRGRWLEFFSAQFRTVEINATFYRLPKREFVERWRDMTPPEFRFAVKMWRRVTHDKALADCEAEIRQFLDVVECLGPKCAVVLVQLPPSLPRDESLLAKFLEEFGRAAAGQRRRLAVEFRSAAWLCRPVYRVLDQFGAAVVLADMPRCAATEPNDANFVYIRRHGPGGRYRGSYSPEQISADARRICGWLRAGRDVFVYFNNDAEGHAVGNARQLVAAVARGM